MEPKKKDREGFFLEVPLDASRVEGFSPDAAVKVVARPCDGPLLEQVVKFSKNGAGVAAFRFEKHPGALALFVGPADASAEEVTGMQTLSLNVSTSQWQGSSGLSLSPVAISSYYWHWWLFWCRTFTIRGRVVCADGHPVPGAQVCAFDVDWFFIWSSTQQVGCATTDINGAFEIKFRWCCGWWPWWWWRYRSWELDPVLSDKIHDVLTKNPPPDPLGPVASSLPSLAPFANLLPFEGSQLARSLKPDDAGQLEGLRASLMAKLPASAELESLHLWPWYPWNPWWDCNPDIIFKVTQDCVTPGAVIVNETVKDTRWNIPTSLSVTLTANEKACCLPHCPDPHCCPDGECLVVTQVCGDPINDIGGNMGAAATPEGYLYPNAVAPGTAAYNGDRPFAGVIPVERNFGDILNVDYLEFEFFDGGSWQPLPPGGAVNFKRRWLETIGFTTGDAAFNFTNISGHEVVETRERFEATGGLPGWNVNRFWLVNRDLLVALDTTKFSDGPHHFRAVGWQFSGGGLINRRVLPICGTELHNEFVLMFDNRVITAVGHPASHNCGGVHVCTLEPDTHISAVRVNGVNVDACDTVSGKEGNLEVDFMVTDPDGHLAVYSLIATYGLNLSVDLLSLPGATITALGMGTQVGPTYGEALGQGASQPHWYGGKYRLTVPASEAFPEPCCYQLELRGYKRTIVGYQASPVVFTCEHGFAYANLTEYTLGVGIC